MEREREREWERDIEREGVEMQREKGRYRIADERGVYLA